MRNCPKGRIIFCVKVPVRMPVSHVIIMKLPTVLRGAGGGAAEGDGDSSGEQHRYTRFDTAPYTLRLRNPLFFFKCEKMQQMPF